MPPTKTWLVVAVVGLVLLVAYAASSPSPIPGSGRQDSAFAESLMAKGNRDARQWLSEDGPRAVRTIGEHTNAGSKAIVADLFRRGAVSVYAVEIDTVPNVGQSANYLVVQLPSNAAARHRLFDFGNQNARRNGFDRISDDGQRYLFSGKLKLTFFQGIRASLGLSPDG